MLYESNALLQAQLLAVATDVLLIGAAGFKVRLAQAPFTPNANSVPGDFTIADYDGYADVTLTTMTGPSQVGSSFEDTASTIAHFAPTGATTPNTIGGYWIESDGGDFLAYEVFPTPIPMQTVLDKINVAIRWQAQPASWPNTLVP